MALPGRRPAEEPEKGRLKAVALRYEKGQMRAPWVTAKGKVKHKKPGLRHLLTGMDSGNGRHMRKAHYLNKVDAAVVKTLIPYR